MRNARVFISCGQKNGREVNIGKAVVNHFKGKGFETYFAERVHSSDGLTENIFKFLKRSEYFVFIDFKRDPLKAEGYRGSLFVNQEIAIATFLKLSGLGFSEKGRKREGILEYHIYNEFEFEDGTEILSKLDEKTKEWDTDSVNELKLSYNPGSTNKNVILSNHPQKPNSDWYHLEVKNRNKNKHAFSCIGYVTKIQNLNNKEEIEIPTIELMWSAIGKYQANIMGGSNRDLDAFYVIRGEGQIRFHQREIHTTNPRYSISNLPKGKYLLEYTVICTNFDNVSQRYLLTFEGTEDEIEFKEFE
jgi:hypothetical protein